MKRAPSFALLLLASAAAFADDEPRAQAEQRVRLAARLIADSPAAQRVRASGNAAAVSHLDEGRLHLSAADNALKAGDFAQARRSADESLHHLGMARRMVPDEPARQLALRQRLEAQLAGVQRLVDDWHARAAGDSDDALIEATGLVGQARRFGEEQRYDEGLRALAAAQQRLLAGFARRFPSREIVYPARSGDDVAATVRDEMASYLALAELVPLAQRELAPRADAQALIARYVQSAQALQAQAQLRLDAGDHDGALVALRNATLFVQRALAAAGVVTPNPTGGLP